MSEFAERMGSFGARLDNIEATQKAQGEILARLDKFASEVNGGRKVVGFLWAFCGAGVLYMMQHFGFKINVP